MSKGNLYRIVIVSYLFILFLQFAVHRRYSIYPSLVFPAFSQAPNIKDTMQYPDIILYAITDKNKLKDISKESFFIGYKKHVNYFLATVIRNENLKASKPSMSRARTDFIKYSVQRLKMLYPNESFKGLQIVKTIKNYDTKKMVIDSPITNVSSTILHFKE